MANVNVILLEDLPSQRWAEIREELSRFTLPPEQAAFGGDPAEFIDLQLDPVRNVFLIYADDALVGVGSILTGPVDPALWPKQTPSIQLRGFIVDHRMQGKGIGTAATAQVIQLAKQVEPEAEHITLTVNQRNPGARRAYEKAGFSTWPEPYTGGPLGPQDIMYKDLA